MAIKNETDTEADLTGVAARTKPKPSVEKIGDRKLKPSTLMMGHGYDPMLSEGSLKPPIFLTSTFVFESAAAGKRHFEGVTGKRPGGAEGLVYSRFNGRAQLFQRHVGDRDVDARAGSPRRRNRAFGAALCSDRNADRTYPRPFRRV